MSIAMLILWKNTDGVWRASVAVFSAAFHRFMPLYSQLCVEYAGGKFHEQFARLRCDASSSAFAETVVAAEQ